jgi:hypothetical protein
MEATMSNNARQVIKDNLIPALTSLGGTASTADIKAEILRMTNTVAEDYGRTKPNKKYPEGRLSFVEKFTLVSVEYKRKGMVFTPAYAHLSLDPNGVVVGKKKPAKIAENHKSSKVKAQSAPVEVETVVVKTGSSQTGEELVAVQSETFDLGDVEIDNQGNVGYVETATPDSENIIKANFEPAPETVLMTEIDGSVVERVTPKAGETFLLGDVEIDNQGNVGYVETPEPTVEEMIAEAEEIVEQVESEEAPVEPDYVLVDEATEYEGLETIAPWSGAIIEAYLDREAGVRIGIDAKGREWTEKLSEEELAQYDNEVAPIEEDDSVVVASTFDEGEIISADSNVVYSEEMSDDSSMAEELIAEAEAEAEAEQASSVDEYTLESEDEGISVNTDLDAIFDDDDLFEDDEEDEGLNLLLEKIEGFDVYGKIEGNETYISLHEDGRVTLKFDNSVPDEFPWASAEKQGTHRERLSQLKGDLKGMVNYISKVKDRRNVHHNLSLNSDIGCFGSDKYRSSICNQCVVRAFCHNVETVNG